MALGEVLIYDAPTVIGVDENDPQGHIPLELLQQGINVRVPIWPKPAGPGQTDRLIVWMERNGVVEFTSTTLHPGPVTESQFLILIGPGYLINDGVVEVRYETINHFGNPHPSAPRTLTIDHTPVPDNLERVKFPDVNDEGYLNCSTSPALWEWVNVKIPPLPDFCKVGDVCLVEWWGYLSLNASGEPIPGTYWFIRKTILSTAELRDGFVVEVKPYTPHIEPMENKASAKVIYTVYRGTRPIGLSKPDFVRIDRVRSGGPSCGPGVP
ncbi:hypothetical protein [Pseudomonas frederiksbergensis]|jgi:hypothetical protein|uniref:Uncharacterized protein n=1 Tax=Pseudomonas frederiksbergensis TaxID=104087 RepID=A0A423J706_9PSED|nr:hypothetical protein [Pseudomonas frederiksbergensis]RON33470.1 hypothetical protein BK661_12465 [Pseudomonas frederiksbergensis]